MTLPQAQPPVDRPEAPRAPLPSGAVDAHVHLVGHDFPLWENRVEDPAPGTLDDWLARYRAHLAALGFVKGVLVHSILHGPDNSVTLEAVRRLGPGFVAVCLVSDDATEAELDALAEAGCRAVRLNYVHGGLLSWQGARRLAPALAARDMHIEMLAHSHLHLVELADDVHTLPCPVVFDHCAWPDLSLGLDTPGHRALVRLLAEGAAWTKLSATYRFAPSPEAARPLVESLVAANPERCLWGTDWPHLMLGGVPRPDAGRLLNEFLTSVPDPETRRQVLVETPARLYRL